MQELEAALKAACQKLFEADVEPVLTRPDEKFGDYSTNVALQLGDNPRESAEKLADALKDQPMLAEKPTVAGPGFLNFKLTDEFLAKAAFSATDLPKPLGGKEILVEFGDPNPFKEMHIGHLYDYIAGDAICNLLVANGADVVRLSYHGDVGLHVAKAIWAMKKAGAEIDSKNVGVYYAQGAKAYEEDEQAKAEIHEINEQVYKQDDPEINELYGTGKKLSFEGFDLTLKKLGISTDQRYLESQSTPIGIKYVQDYTGKVFEESEGAIVYKGEKVGLHTRVFLTSKGLPTYEAKDLGLAELKNKDYPEAARSVIITANEQIEYFRVMLAALAEIDKDLAAKTTHMSHGFVNLSTGKMSSRSGNVYSATDLLDAVEAEVKKQYPDANPENKTYLAAAKYGFLKHRLGTDIAYDINESVSLEGNSGPYLQYAHARASSILAKVQVSDTTAQNDLEAGERSLARKISEYPEVVAKATTDLMPHYICTYLYELAQAFNRFYEGNRVIDDPRQATRLKLVSAYAGVLKHGLGLLNISAPEHI